MAEDHDIIATPSEIDGQMECVKCGGTRYRFLKKKRRVNGPSGPLVMTDFFCLKCGERYGIPEDE